MANDENWVEDVRRWCLAGSNALRSRQSSSPTEAEPATDFAALGYEAAHPALQARNWPEAPTTNLIDEN